MDDTTSKVDQRFSTDASHLFQIAHAADARYHRTEDHRSDDHADEPDECVPERLHCGRVLRVQMTEQDASGNRQQHLHVQNFVEGLSHDVVFR
jgi:hypothetical protein